MFNAIQERLLIYIRENRPDLLNGIHDKKQIKAYLEELMWDTKNLIKRLLKEGTNRNQIQWLCLGDLIKKISYPDILIITANDGKGKYRSCSKDEGLNAQMIDIMCAASKAISSNVGRLCCNVNGVDRRSLRLHFQSVTALN